MEHQRYEAEFAAEVARLATVASGLDPARTVVSCPEWTVRDLVTHVGRGHRWAATLVAERRTAPGEFGTAGAPTDPADWAGWLTGGADGLVEAIRETGADHPVWTWQRDPTAGFWLRRMLHDLIVHRFDAELTAGGPGPIGADLAADGVDDMLGCLAVIGRATLAGAGETLRFEAVDHPAGWLAERTPAGVTWNDHDDAAADVTVRAPVRELLLLLNRRIGPGAVQVTGDGALLAHWWENSKF
jgi:uncharacterized protein (TIGR03083 family)